MNVIAIRVIVWVLYAAGMRFLASLGMTEKN
jgi:hypothetical protein